jgi:hypothetical protein
LKKIDHESRIFLDFEHALGALEFHEIPVPAKADKPYPLPTAFTKGDLLHYRGPAGRLNALQIFGDFAFLPCVQQAALRAMVVLADSTVRL